MCAPEDPEVAKLRAEVEVWKERALKAEGDLKTVWLKNALLRDALTRCVNTMSTLEVGVPLQVAMADPKFRAFFDAAQNGKRLLENTRPETSDSGGTKS